MATISSDSFTVYNAEVRMKKGPLVKVHRGAGRYVKMHREDAIEQGLIAAPEKAQPKGQDKQRLPEREKGEERAEARTTNEVNDAATVDDFTVIDGVGPATARALAANGVTTFDELQEAGELDYLSAGVNAAIEAWRNGG